VALDTLISARVSLSEQTVRQSSVFVWQTSPRLGAELSSYALTVLAQPASSRIFDYLRV